MKISLLALFAFVSSIVFAQEIKVSGHVLSSVDNTALKGATINIRKTNKGTQTDENGNYSITAVRGARLTITFIGYTSQEVTIKDNTVVDILLAPVSNSLNEVVVTGFTTQRKSDVTAAISTISSAELLKSPVANVTNALVGKVPGLIAQQTSGRPGMNQSELYIRGRVSNDAKALIVVDGIERESFGDIDANEIESITVLKDAASTAMYGIKGANEYL